MTGSNQEKAFQEFDRGTIEDIGEYISPETLYSDVIERVRRYHPSDDITLIEKGYEIARSAHEGQKRKSGEPYIIHPVAVAQMESSCFYPYVELYGEYAYISYTVARKHIRLSRFSLKDCLGSARSDR